MEAVKNKLNAMKVQAEESEERVIKFESALRTCQQHLEAALKEKDSLCKRIEIVETQIINADRQRGDISDRLQELESSTDNSESKRKALENRELEGDLVLDKLENRLKHARESYKENLVRCEEAERRLKVLTQEYNNTHFKRVKLEEHAGKLEADIDGKIIKLRDYEQIEMQSSRRDFRFEDHLKLLNSYHREAEERCDIGRLNVTRLQRLVEEQQDEIEAVRMRTKAKNVELQNAMQEVIGH